MIQLQEDVNINMKIFINVVATMRAYESLFAELNLSYPYFDKTCINRKNLQIFSLHLCFRS